jgi:hypothetical protein
VFLIANGSSESMELKEVGCGSGALGIWPLSASARASRREGGKTGAVDGSIGGRCGRGSVVAGSLEQESAVVWYVSSCMYAR